MRVGERKSRQTGDGVRGRMFRSSLLVAFFQGSSLLRRGEAQNFLGRGLAKRPYLLALLLIGE